MEKIHLSQMKFPEDKQQIADWEKFYGNSPEFASIRHFILEDNTYTGLDEVIETNHEIFHIGEDEKKLALVAKNNQGEILAWILLDTFDVTTNYPQMFLQYIVVNPKYQNKGYGTAIAKELFLSPEKYVGVKPKEFFAYVNTTNYPSLILFSKFNFNFRPVDKHYIQAKTSQPKLESSKDSPASFEL